MEPWIIKGLWIDISPALNDMILKAVEKSSNGFLAGVGIDVEKGLVKYISFLGQSVKVEVISDMPAKAGKAFNFLVEEIGKHGAIAMPNVFNAGSMVREHYEGMAMLGTILEAVGLVAGLKLLQPELNFGSFEV